MIAAEYPLELSVRTESWPLASVFTISRGSKTHADVVVVELKDQSVTGSGVTGSRVTGRGECVPYARYNETVPQVVVALESCRKEIEAGLSVNTIRSLPLPQAARNALDCALWDLVSKTTASPAWQLAGLAAPLALTTAYTISLDTPEAMARAAASCGRPLLKLKLGREGDKERLHAIRTAVPGARLIVDANEGWSTKDLPTLLRVARDTGVELVEQPLPANADVALKGLSRDCLICADESAHGLESLADLVGKYDAINIKLDKTGGLTPALELARAARSSSLDIMVGCMVATSLAMAPAMLLGQLARYVDLDGPLLLKHDREDAIQYDGNIMQWPPRALWG